MKKSLLVVGSVVVGLVLAALLVIQVDSLGSSPSEAVAQGGGAEYIGSQQCGDCHTEVYSTFIKSGHPWKLNPVVDGQPPRLSLHRSTQSTRRLHLG